MPWPSDHLNREGSVTLINAPKNRGTILLYADDPGAANYLAPLPKALLKFGLTTRFVVSPALAEYCKDREIIAETRIPRHTPEQLLNGVDVVVLGTSEERDCWGHKLLLCAKDQKTQVVGVVDMAVNADKRFRGYSDNPLQFAPDWIVVPDSFCESSFLKIGFSQDRILPIGHPHYDEVRSKRPQCHDASVWRTRYFPKAPNDRPLWLFLAEGVDRLDSEQSFRNEDYTLHGRGDTNFRAAICLQELIDAAQDLTPKPWIVLRPHPKNKPEEFSACIAGIDEWAIGGDPTPMLLGADLVVGMTTMLLLEAYLLGCPTLSIIPRNSERTWLPTIMGNLTVSVTTRNELRTAIKHKTYISKPSGVDELHILPVGATAKLANFICDLL